MRQPGRAERLDAALARDRGEHADRGGTCVWCARELGGRVPATTDHVVPRVKGGPSWLENEVAACLAVNQGEHADRGARGHRGAVEWLEECERRGWSPDAERLRRVLRSLVGAIEERGGQRRARPHLDAQLRRLARRHRSSA